MRIHKGEFYSAIVLMVMMTMVYGCATWEGFVKAGLEGKVLYDEFEDAATALRAIPLDPSEKAVIEVGISELDDIREEVGKLKGASVGEVVVTATQTRKYLDDTAEVYNRILPIIAGHYAQTGHEIPEDLVAYHDIALDFWKTLDKQVEEGKALFEGSDMIEMVKLVFRVYASTHGVSAWALQ